MQKMNAGFLKAMLQGVSDAAEIHVEQIDKYNAQLVIEDGGYICTIGEIGFDEWTKEE